MEAYLRRYKWAVSNIYRLLLFQAKTLRKKTNCFARFFYILTNFDPTAVPNILTNDFIVLMLNIRSTLCKSKISQMYKYFFFTFRLFEGFGATLPRNPGVTLFHHNKLYQKKLLYSLFS